MYFGEDKCKVYNIVRANRDHFKYLYKEHLNYFGVTAENGYLKKVYSNFMFLPIESGSYLVLQFSLINSTLVNKLAFSNE